MTAPAAAGASPTPRLHVVTDAETAALEAAFARARDLADRMLGDRPMDPARLLSLQDQQLLEELLVDELEAQSLATNTRDNYYRHVQAWLTWCEQRERCPLPANASDVARHLAGYGVRHDPETGVDRDADGRLQPAVTPGSVALRMAAIDKLHEYAGENRPSTDEAVRRVMRGLRRTFGVRPQRARAALDWHRLRLCVSAARGQTRAQLRTRAMLLGRARAGATAGQLVRLRWEDVELHRDRAVLMLPPSRRGSPATAVTVGLFRSVETCLVRTLRELHEIHDGDFLLADPSGRPLTRQAVHRQLSLAGAALGGDLTGAREADLRRYVGARTGQPSRPAALRDAALLLTGWFAALRRSNLCALQWRDLTDVAAGEIRIDLRFSKTDQERAGEFVFLPRNGADPSMCPVTALRTWHRALTELLGQDPRRTMPTSAVFPALNRHGSLLREVNGAPAALSGDAVNELVQRLAVAAGLATDGNSRYGGHSLRVGFVTECVRREMTVPQIMAITKHKDARTVFKYTRTENTAENNVGRELLNRMATAATA